MMKQNSYNHNFSAISTLLTVYEELTARSYKALCTQNLLYQYSPVICWFIAEEDSLNVQKSTRNSQHILLLRRKLIEVSGWHR